MRHKFRENLLSWYELEGRKFFWRNIELTPFKVLVLEILLRRTRAETVDKYCEEFVQKYDNPEKITSQSLPKLKSEIDELGYQSRMDDLRRISSEISNDGLPESREELLNIEGIGQYIADSILCYGYGKPRVPIDMNVARVGEYYFDIDIPSDLRYADELKEEMEEMVPENEAKVFNWALQDLGSEMKNQEDPLSLK